MRTNTEFVFMSTGLFEHLNETESYVFFFVTYFACDKQKGQVFKRITASLCNNLGYSANTIRSTIDKLVEKNFLARAEKPDDKNKALRYNYFDDISHYLVLGTHKYAQEFSSELSEILNFLRKSSKHKKPNLKNVFFKVYVNALQASKKGEKWKRNQSRHLHKTLVLHGYLHNKIKFRDKFDKSTLSLSVPYLSAMMQWSRNTVRRVVNTLVELGLVTLKLEGKRIAFLQVRLAERVREGYKQLKSRLFDVRQKTVGVTLNSINKPMGLNRPGKHATPAEHASYLAAMKKAQNH